VFDLTGASPITVVYQLNGGPLEEWEFVAGGRQSQPISRGGNYRIIAVEDRACRIRVDTTIRADFFEPAINPRLQNPSCGGQSDGSIAVTHLPTVEPYTYNWAGVNPTGLTVTGLSAGNYSLTVTDALGCSSERRLDLRDPDPISPIDINCTTVRRPPLVLSAGGGVPPYTYSVDGVNYFDRNGFGRLNEGEYYTLRIRDAVGCETEQPNFFYPTATRRPARLPNFVPQEIAGSSVVEAEYFVPLDQITAYRWHPAALFDCPTCPNPKVSAPSSQPISLAVDNIYGCTDSLVTFVALDGRIPVYVPNIFTPNGDGNNDFVAIYANTDQVDRVVSFQVHSRWGELLWEGYDFAPNDGRRGWDGMLNGQPASIAAYVWVAEVRLTTGVLQREAGTVVLMR